MLLIKKRFVLCWTFIKFFHASILFNLSTSAKTLSRISCFLGNFSFFLLSILFYMSYSSIGIFFYFIELVKIKRYPKNRIQTLLFYYFRFKFIFSRFCIVHTARYFSYYFFRLYSLFQFLSWEILPKIFFSLIQIFLFHNKAFTTSIFLYSLLVSFYKHFWSDCRCIFVPFLFSSTFS